MQDWTEEPLFNTEHSGYVETAELWRHGTNVRDFGVAPGRRKPLCD